VCQVIPLRLNRAIAAGVCQGMRTYVIGTVTAGGVMLAQVAEYAAIAFGLAAAAALRPALPPRLHLRHAS
jgi:hypothetical protein